MTLAAYGGVSAALGQALGRTTDWFEVAVIEIANLDTVVEQNAVAQPVETVGEEHNPLRTGRNSAKVNTRTHPFPDFQIELAFMWRGQRMRFPDRHPSILPDRGAWLHHMRAHDEHECVLTGRGDSPAVHSSPCEELGGTPRGEQGQGLCRG
jgi:hypothetical protein